MIFAFNQGRALQTWSVDLGLDLFCSFDISTEHNGLVFTKPGWMNTEITFIEKTEKGYGVKQLKNRLEILKKELRTWDTLLKETGAGGTQ
ncbi:hypothetical protein QN277_003790 [Acacia crassicarpa]|uniref:Myb/SANT-like domain-containing protein n=1 Tax=Acacia crassicarpa TaxID=499986 RepID=A0AAE1MD43_9FABA|nr:hypothetical protein QN277_003790 [Acacia crassicarpa]